MKNKKDYKENFQLIRSVINNLDPMNLIKNGAPKDEYDAEVSLIVAGLKNCKDVKDLQELIHDIFKTNFNEKTVLDSDFYSRIAHGIFKVLAEK